MQRTRRHTGVVYLTVLSVSMIVIVIGVGALMVVRQQALASDGANDLDNARMAARSGIDLTRYLITSDSSWRTNRQNGSWGTISIRTAQCNLSVTDPLDSNLSNCLSDSVLVTSTGISGTAQQIMQVTLAAERKPLTCLGVVLAANGGFNIQANGLNSDQTVSTNGTLVTTANINSDAEAPGLLVALGSGARTSLATARTFPAATAFDWYIANGTAISISAIPSKKIQNVTISATSNPYGTANAQGIYVIDCQNQKLTIQDSLITATLVILNPASNSTTGGVLGWIAPAANMPALLVRGSFNFGHNAYPSMMRGLCYVSGDLTVNSACTINGQLIVGGALNMYGGLTLSYDASAYNDPPQGFYELPCKMRPVAGSWRPAVN